MMAGILDTDTDELGLDTSLPATGILERKNDNVRAEYVAKTDANERAGEMDTAVRRKMHTRAARGHSNEMLNTDVDMVPYLDTGGSVQLDTSIPGVKLDIPKEPGSRFDAVESSVYDKDGWGFNTMDFLFGAEAAVIGIAHDADGFSWNMQNLKQQWSEQPIWVNALSVGSLLGTMVLPASLAVRGAIKTGGLATKLAVGTAKEVDEIARWTKAGWINADEGVTPWAKYADIEGGQKTITELRRLELATTAAGKRAKRAAAAEAGDLSAFKNPIDSALYQWEKRFTNTYFETINGVPGSGQDGLRKAYNERLEKLWGREEVTTMLSNLPDPTEGLKISAYLMAKIDPGVAARVTKEGTAAGLSKEGKAWADFYWEAEKRGQSERLASGFIDADTYKRIGEGHMAALSPRTPKANLAAYTTHLLPIQTGKAVRGKGKKTADLVEKEVEKTGIFGGKKKVTEIVVENERSYVPVQLYAQPTMTGPTMLHRAGTHDEVYDRLISGNLISDPGDVTAHGYLTSELLHENFKFIRDLVAKPENIATAEEIAIMVGKSAEDAAKMGFVKLDNAGPGAAAALTRMIAKNSPDAIEGGLPYIRKHLWDEIFGPGGMMNQTTHAATNLMDVSTTIFKTMKTGFSIPTHLQNAGGNLAFMSQAGFAITDTKNIAMMGQLSHTFDQIFDMMGKAKKYHKGERRMFDTDGGILKGIDLGKIDVPSPGGKMKKFDLNEEFAKNPVMKELLEQSSFHAAESAGHLDQLAATLGDKQYLTKGLVEVFARGKKVAQIGDKAKWMDSMTKAYLAEDMVPKMALYMHYRGQGLSKSASATLVARRLPMYNTVGSAISYGRKWAFPWATFSTEAARITKNNLMDAPIRMLPWLRTPQIMQAMASGMGYAPETRQGVNEAKSQLPFWAQKGTTVITEGKAGAAAGGAMLGGILGATTGAISGQTPGAVVTGALGGAAFGGFLAAMTTDSVHAKQLRGALQDWLPHSTFTLSNTSREFGGEGWLPFQDVQGAIEQSPIEPMAILQPILAIMTGEDQFGNPVDPEVGGGLAKTIAGAIGFLSPPIIQKYGFKITTPQVGLLGDPSGITNVSRALIDSGNAIDPQTGLPGSLTHDLMLNNFSLWKSYAASAQTQIANEHKSKAHMREVRSNISRNLAFHLENGNDKEIVALLSRVMGTFANENIGNPKKATSEYGDWLMTWTERIGTHPKLRNWNLKDLTERLELSLMTQAEARSAALNNMIEAMRDEIRVRGGEEYQYGQTGKSMDAGLELGMKKPDLGLALGKEDS